MQMGGDQELIVALRTPGGDVWGGARPLPRARNAPMFDRDEIAFLRAIAPAARRGARAGAAARRGQRPRGPGRARARRPLADWERRVGDPRRRALALRPARTATGMPASCRPRCWPWRAGRCARRRAATSPARSRWPACSPARDLGRPARRNARSHGRRRVAVIVEPAHPARITPLLMSACGLTEPRAGGHPPRAPGRLDGADRRAPRRLAAHRPGAPEEHLREDRRAQPRDLVGSNT